jgi:hypothetical protein
LGLPIDGQKENMKMKKFNVGLSLLVVAVCTLFFTPGNAYADTVTLTFESVGGQSSGNDYVYPYNFSINGSSTLTPLMCLSFTQDISQGESWQATVDPVLGNTEYEEAAYIFSLAAAPGASQTTIADAQWANWELFDPGASSSLPGSVNQADVTTILDNAATYVLNNPDSSLYSNLEVFVPVAGSQPWGDVTPQIFIGDSPAPEPGTLVLLGTGLLGLAASLYRKKRLA